MNVYKEKLSNHLIIQNDDGIESVFYPTDLDKTSKIGD